MIRLAEMADFPQILAIYQKAREFMKENGNPSQWGDTFPREEVLKNDIEEKRHLYVITRGENGGEDCAEDCAVEGGETGETIVGVFALIIGPDPTYAVIEPCEGDPPENTGFWLDESLYGTIHRLASGGRAHGIFAEAIAYSRRQIAHLRIDTHADNLIMQRLIARAGFSRRGIIYTDDGSPRIAYELI